MLQCGSQGWDLGRQAWRQASTPELSHQLTHIFCAESSPEADYGSSNLLTA